jgi:hypothetical protein
VKECEASSAAAALDCVVCVVEMSSCVTETRNHHEGRVV